MAELPTHHHNSSFNPHSHDAPPEDIQGGKAVRGGKAGHRNSASIGTLQHETNERRIIQLRCFLRVSRETHANRRLFFPQHSPSLARSS